MGLSTLKDTQSIFIGKTPVAKTTGAIDAMNEGEIGIFTPQGARVTEATAATINEFIIAQGRGLNPPIISDVIDKRNIKRGARKVLSAATEQVDYVGFNGTSGAIDVIDNNLYYIRLNISNVRVSNHGGRYTKRGSYTSPLTGTTQSLIAQQLTKNLIAEFSQEADRQVKFERVHSNAGAATTATTGIMTATYKSKYVACAGGTPSTDFQVGSLVRFGTTTTSPVYLVTAVDDTLNTITLDIPYQGTSGTFAIAAAQFITPALAAAGDFGIKMTGVPLSFQLGYKEYEKSRWKTTIEGFGTSTVTMATGATEGSGTYEDMAQVEYFVQMLEGNIYKDTQPNVFPGRMDISNQGYDQIHIDVVVPNSTGINSLGITNAPKLYTFIIPNATPAFADGGTADDITDVLEVLVFGSVNGNFAL